jgi:signal transduction histidine kinase
MASLLALEPPTILQSVLDEAGVGLAIINRDGKLALTNQALLNIFGMAQNPSGMSVVDWRSGYKFENEQGLEVPVEESLIVRALAGEATYPQNFRVTLPDGSVKWLHGAGHHFSILGLEGVLVIVTDETEEVELRRAAEKIHRIETAEVLASSLAHDFNNMLSVVAGSLTLALSDPGLGANAGASLQQATQALDRGAALAKKLARFTHPQEVQTRAVAVNDVVKGSVQLIRPLLGDGVQLRLDLRDGLPIIQADPDEIEQALINLMLNALDAMPQGGELKVSTGLESPAPDQGGTAEQFVSIGVADTGMGIPERLQARIFEPYFTTKTQGRGSGLGLASAYRIVGQYKGHIEVKSAPHLGTKFTVFLPAQNAA